LTVAAVRQGLIAPHLPEFTEELDGDGLPLEAEHIFENPGSLVTCGGHR